ncbi:hypothetical protein C0989_011606 [Termitomyces sp. Mn162]|nr:hypothetical protein C0989_011606 [Termitomyces sp. Mn162]
MDAIRNIPAILAISLVLAGLLISFVCKARRSPLPPGPRGWPIVGNIFNLPPRGDPLPWLGVGWDQQLILAQYGDHFRAMRKMMKTYLGSPSAITNFRHIQELETRYFLTRILDDPANLISHIRWTAGAISLRISHGYIIETDQPDPLVDLVETAAKDFYAITMPGAWLVDIFPIMKYLPDWMPFKQAAATYRSHNLEQTERPHSFVKNRMRAGTELPSFTSDMMSTGPDEATEHAVKYAATAIYGGASDTTVAALSAFMLLMLLYPDVQKRARDELDSVVGNKRLPNFDDRPSLPYLEATMKEVMRWHSTGRIVCPGKDLANANMFIATAMTLSVFEISKGKDENGIEIEPRCEFEGGTVSHPLPFAFTLKPRSPEAEDLIRIVNEEAPRRPSDGPYL